MSSGYSERLPQVLSKLSGFARINLTHVPYLKQLGDILREEEARVDPLVLAYLPTFVEQVNFSLLSCRNYTENSDSVVVALEVLRVLCNIVADNNNRMYFLNNENFLCNVRDSLYPKAPVQDSVNQRLLVCLGNMVKENECLPNSDYFADALLSFFEYTFMKTDIAQLDGPINMMAELFEPEDLKSHLTSKQLALFLDAFERIVESNGEFDDDSLDDLLVSCSNLVYKASDYTDDSNVNFQENLFHAIRKLNELDASRLNNLTKINRRLFASSGNISSNPKHSNVNELETCISEIELDSNPYITSAAAILLGNYISSEETRSNLISKLPSNFTDQLFATFNRFNDIIQYQAFHLLNNVVLSSMIDDIISETNWPIYLKLSKTLFDNKSYYKEVLTINFKFMKKIIKLSNRDQLSFILTNDDFFKLLHDTINDDAFGIEVEQVYCVLVESITSKKMVAQNETLLITLLKSLLKLGNKISMFHLFEKIKIIGLVLGQNIISPETDDKTFGKLVDFIINLYENVLAIQENQIQPGFNALLNNSKYVAAKLLEFKGDFGRKAEFQSVTDDILHINV